MIRREDAVKRISIENDALRITVDLSEGLRFAGLENLRCPAVANPGCEAFELELHGKKLTGRDFSVCSVTESADEACEMLSILAECAAEEIAVRLHLINDRRDTISVLYQVRDDYKLGAPTVVKFHMPLLGRITAGEGGRIYYPASPVKSRKGTDVVVPMMESFYSSDVLLPLVVCDRDDRFGYSVEFPTVSDLSDTGAVQNINKLLTGISDEEQLRRHSLQINPDASFNDTAELRITGLTGGWAEAFDRYRNIWQSAYDFSEYDKPDLKWFDTCVVNNFTFLYGSEGFDHEKGKIDVEGLLRQGEAFGGYDTVTIWNMYPRLGVDTKSQWSFYDEFPGGREALREAVAAFHRHGVKVFLPYIPWDQGNDMDMERMGDEFAKIVADTDADGYQLDTLRDLPYSFRKKLDAVRPGLILTTQHHPLKKHPTEYITTSWDEFWRTDPMPELDVFRFIFPQHLAPVISRWLRLEDKDTLVKRCEFGGAPIVIWQDIFGRWMPFTDAQKADIKRWKEVYLAHRAQFQGSKPVPLYPTFTDDLYCNIFPDDAGEAEVYSFYNDSDTPCELVDFKLRRAAKQAQVILGDARAEAHAGLLRLTVAPREVVQVLVR